MSELDKLYGYLFDVNTYIERMTGVEGYESPVAKLIEVRDLILKFISMVEEKDPMFFAGDGSNYTTPVAETDKMEPINWSTEDDGFLFDLSPDDEEYPFIQDQE